MTKSLTNSAYNRLFQLFLFSVVLIFFWIRPFNSPNHPFIAGDGLGYYAHLPATFIYRDSHYHYRWFNEVHDSNYAYSAFEDPGRNLLVDFHGRKVNKFYPGLSVIWLPFFFAAHLVAGLTGFEADGFSMPYQLAIALASLVYLLIGLIALRRLTGRLFTGEAAGVLVPVVFFYGTHLFPYAIHANSLSHAYSFTFVVLFIDALVALNTTPERCRWLLRAAFYLSVIVAIRPLDALVIFLVPAFISRSAIRNFRCAGLRMLDVVPGLAAAFTAFALCYISYRQTGSFFSYTYTDEKFNFMNGKFPDALFSYHLGLFVYVPLLLFSFAGLRYVGRAKMLILPVVFLLFVYLYASWWYWPVVKRAMTDVYVIPAVCLGALLSRPRGFRWKLVLLAVCVIYYQFKSYQMRAGILDEFSTYSELYWRNFFRVKKADIYPIPPSTVRDKIVVSDDFERNEPGHSEVQAFSGTRSFLLDSTRYIGNVLQTPFPAILEADGSHKIRLSLRWFPSHEITSVHAFITFVRHDGSVYREIPFYVNKDHLFSGQWDYKEFGFEPLPEDSITAEHAGSIRFTVWNVAAKGRLYIDDAKAEFILADRSLETFK